MAANHLPIQNAQNKFKKRYHWPARVGTYKVAAGLTGPSTGWLTKALEPVLLLLEKKSRKMTRIVPRSSTLLRKNAVWAFRRCQSSFSKIQIPWKMHTFFQQFYSSYDWSFCSWKFHREIFMNFFSRNVDFIRRNVATFDCAYDVSSKLRCTERVSARHRALSERRKESINLPMTDTLLASGPRKSSPGT